MALGDDIKAALLAAGVGTDNDPSADWQIFVGYLQDTPDRAICIIETGGDAPLEKWAIDYPGFQTRVRGGLDDYQAARQKMKDIFNVLHAGEVEINVGVSPPSATYIYCYCQQSGVISLGQDEKRRPGIVQNYKTMKNRAI